MPFVQQVFDLMILPDSYWMWNTLLLGVLTGKILPAAMPKSRYILIRELPPYDIKGKVTPVIGMIPIFMPIFTWD
jgi:hypothetical protein